MTPYFFDVLQVDDTDLLECARAERGRRARGARAGEAPGARLVTADPAEAQRFVDQALGGGT